MTDRKASAKQSCSRSGSWGISVPVLCMAAFVAFAAAAMAGCKTASPEFSRYTLDLSGGMKLEMVKVEAGTFQMGSPEDESGRDFDETRHQVTLTQDFYIGRTEVTQAQWKAVMGENPSDFKGDDLPVENVSWNDAMAFCEKLNEKAPAGWKFTLPTEAQWEYASRGGEKSKGYIYSGSNAIDEMAWYEDNSGLRTHSV